MYIYILDVSSQATSSMNGFISSDSSAPKIQQLLGNC